MMLRNVAFSNLVKGVYPNHLRLSIHAHDNSTKFGVALVAGLQFLRTPWHNVAVRMRDGSVDLLQREEAEARDDLRLIEQRGRPYLFEQF